MQHSGHRAISLRTTRIYSSHYTAFASWCEGRGVSYPVPVQTIADYLNHCTRTQGRRSTLVCLSALRRLFQDRGLTFDRDAPPIRAIIQTIRQEIQLQTAHKDIA